MEDRYLRKSLANSNKFSIIIDLNLYKVLEFKLISGLPLLAVEEIIELSINVHLLPHAELQIVVGMSRCTISSIYIMVQSLHHHHSFRASIAQRKVSIFIFSDCNFSVSITLNFIVITKVNNMLISPYFIEQFK